MSKQLSIYDKLTNGAGRSVWREKAKTFKSTYKVAFKKIEILAGLNVRTVFEGIEELAADLEANGQNEPLEGVLTEDGKFLVFDGERRYRAIQLLRKKNLRLFEEVEVVPLPAKMSMTDIIIRMLSGGVHKSIYKDVEIANGLLRLKEDSSLSNAEIGEKMGKSRQWVDNMMKLAKQPDEIKEKVSKGTLTKTTVVAPQKEDLKEVAAGLTKPSITPGLPPSLKTDNKKAEQVDMSMEAAGKLNQMTEATKVSGKDALQGVNFDKEINEQEAAINRIAKNLNKIESLGKGLNDQGQKDLESYLRFCRTDIEDLKTYYSKFKNRQVQ